MSIETPADLRAACRSNQWNSQTSGQVPGYAQANLVILPEADADDFMGFCESNPKPCPLLEVTSPGEFNLRKIAKNADLRTDLPLYRVWEHGKLIDEPTDIKHLWRDDLVSFLIGCSFTFESALLDAGLPVRHIELNRNVPMYRTNVECQPSGKFRGPLVVSMRPMSPSQAIEAIQITSKVPQVHGAPVHFGLPNSIGITNLDQPDYGDSVPIEPHELPVFWACGVTPQAAIAKAKPAFVITHSPGCMFVSDLRDRDLMQANTQSP